MSELLLIERLLYFALPFGISFVIGAIHGFCLVRHPRLSWLIPITTFTITIGSFIFRGVEVYAATWVSAPAPYVIVGTVIGVILGEILGIKIGNRD